MITHALSQFKMHWTNTIQGLVLICAHEYVLNRWTSRYNFLSLLFAPVCQMPFIYCSTYCNMLDIKSNIALSPWFKTCIHAVPEFPTLHYFTVFCLSFNSLCLFSTRARSPVSVLQRSMLAFYVCSVSGTSLWVG